MKHRIHPLAAAIAAICSSLAFAQAERPPAAPALDPVLVEASRLAPLPFANRQSASDFGHRPTTTSDSASLFEEIPGVSLYRAGGLSSLPAMHGLADDRLRIKVDGMDLIASCPNHMNPALSTLAPASIGSTQAYVGVTPVSVGGDSIGGSLVVESRPPEFAAAGQGLLSKGELGAFYRSNNDARGANLSATLASESLSLSYRGSTTQANNYHAGDDFKSSAASGRPGHALDLDEVGSTAYQAHTHRFGLALRHENHLLEASFGYQDQPYQLYPNQRMDLLDNEQKSVNLRHLGEFAWGRLETRVYRETVDHFMDFGDDKRYWYGTDSGGSAAVDGRPCATPGSPTCANGMPMYTEGQTQGLRIQADVAMGEDLLRLGSDLQTYRLDDWWPPSGAGMAPGTFWNIHDGERDRLGLFGEWETRLAPRWTGLFGLRYEQVRSDAGPVRGYDVNSNGMGSMPHNQKRDADAFNAADRSQTDHNWDVTALARYTADPSLEVEFGFARKVRSPNLYERYSWSTWQMAALMNNFVGDGNGYVGDPELKPEQAHTLSTTLDWHSPDRHWGLRVTPFYTRVTDYIDALPINHTQDARFDVLRYTNQSARLYGVDLAGHLPLGRTELGRFGLRGQLSYTDGKNRDTGDALYNIMPLNTRLTLTHQSGGWDNALEWIAVQAKNEVADVRNEVETDGYSLFNLRASYTWNAVRIDFGVENLTDKYYVLPLGGAYLGQGTTMTTTATPTGSVPQTGVGVPGMGRSLYAGFNLRF